MSEGGIGLFPPAPAEAGASLAARPVHRGPGLRRDEGLGPRFRGDDRLESRAVRHDQTTCQWQVGHAGWPKAAERRDGQEGCRRARWVAIGARLTGRAR